MLSRSLTSVGPNATLVSTEVVEAVQAFTAERDGEVEVAGPELADSLGGLGLIDEYRMYVHPVAIGQGKPYFAGPRPALRLLSCAHLVDGVVQLSYAP